MSDRSRGDRPGSSAATRALLGLCALQAALFLTAIGLQKAGSPGELVPPAKAGDALAAGIVLAILAGTALARDYRRAGAGGRRGLAIGAIANLAGLAVALAGAESVLRLMTVQTREGLTFHGVTLPPTWDEIRARNAEVMATAAGFRKQWLRYMVRDPDLGWSVGPSRSTPDGMYFSSAEGLRSGREGVVYADRSPALRIALVGDSYTFAMDGPFEDSWGDQLEQRLGRKVQVLNFGVDGYGVDQAYLRYRRDVTPWHPDIVLFGVVQHDLTRTVSVYPFISFHWDYPFAKPRFIVAGKGLELLNAPLISPRAILQHDDVSTLPFVDYDIGYRQSDWRWRRGNPLLVARLFGLAFRRFPAAGPDVSDDAAIAISGRLVRAFLQLASANGSAARVLYFPSQGAGDFDESAPAGGSIARRMLASFAPEHLDLTACVRAVPAPLRLIAGKTHYTRQANGKVAGCVAADLAAQGWLTAIK